MLSTKLHPKRPLHALNTNVGVGEGWFHAILNVSQVTKLKKGAWCEFYSDRLTVLGESLKKKHSQETKTSKGQTVLGRWGQAPSELLNYLGY